MAPVTTGVIGANPPSLLARVGQGQRAFEGRVPLGGVVLRMREAVSPQNGLLLTVNISGHSFVDGMSLSATLLAVP